MVCSVGDSHDISYCTAYSFSKAVDRNVSIRILNASSSDVELHVRQKIAKFWPVVDLASAQQTSSSAHDFVPVRLILSH